MASNIFAIFSKVFSSFSIPITIVVLTLLAIVSTIWYLGSGAIDPKEPPLAYTKLPLIGHIIGLLWYQNAYFDKLRAQNPWPILTLKIFSTRMYIIVSPDLAQSALRSSKDIDFETIKQHAACKAIEFDQHGTDIVGYQPKAGESSYLLDLHQEMYGALSQGPSLQQTTAKVLRGLADSLNSIGTTSKSRPLFRWLADSYSIATANAFYGVPNPVSEDPSLVQSIIDFDRDIGLLVLDVLPSITARKGHAARRTITPLFEKYYNAGQDKNADTFIIGRTRCGRKWGLTTEELSKADISILMAGITNSVPNVFFAICNLFSNVDLLNSIRDEVEEIVTRKLDNGMDTVTLNVAGIQTSCPLLGACFHETLRLTKTGASVRTTLSDVMLNDQYLLKKGAIIQIPTGVLQSDPKTWGADAKVFNPRRFLTKDSLPKEAKKAQSQAFIPFGGGRNLCPGRHLASVEVTAFLAMLIYGFEVKRADGGVLGVPEAGNQLGVGSRQPKKDIDVVVKTREEFKGVKWNFDLGDGEASSQA